MKGINIQALALNASDSPMFLDSIISLKLNDSDFETSEQNFSTVKDKPFFHDAVFKAVIDVMYKSAEYEEEETVESVEVEL